MLNMSSKAMACLRINGYQIETKEKKRKETKASFYPFLAKRANKKGNRRNVWERRKERSKGPPLEEIKNSIYACACVSIAKCYVVAHTRGIISLDCHMSFIIVINELCFLCAHSLREMVVSGNSEGLLLRWSPINRCNA